MNKIFGRKTRQRAPTVSIGAAPGTIPARTCVRPTATTTTPATATTTSASVSASVRMVEGWISLE
ncbi:hypothetical protein N9408_07275 [Opitutales bacterium]|nr:hypothetical protein [Opitutales bacterium]